MLLYVEFRGGMLAEQFGALQQSCKRINPLLQGLHMGGAAEWIG